MPTKYFLIKLVVGLEADSDVPPEMEDGLEDIEGAIEAGLEYQLQNSKARIGRFQGRELDREMMRDKTDPDCDCLELGWAGNGHRSCCLLAEIGDKE